MWLTTNADFESVSAQGLQRKLENRLSDVRRRRTHIRGFASRRSAKSFDCEQWHGSYLFPVLDQEVSRIATIDPNTATKAINLFQSGLKPALPRWS
jgi:hypothetical protein